MLVICLNNANLIIAEHKIKIYNKIATIEMISTLSSFNPNTFDEILSQLSGTILENYFEWRSPTRETKLPMLN